MRAEDLRPGDWVVWNGRRASVTHTTGQAGQLHPWGVGLVFDGLGDGVAVTVVVPADQDLEIAF